VLVAVAIGTAGVCAYSLVDFYVRGGGWDDRLIRAGVPFPGSDGSTVAYNWLSTYTVIAIPLVLSLGAATRVWWQRIVYSAVFVLALLALVFSYTRGAWLGVVAEGFVFGLFSRRFKLALCVLLCCLGIGAGLLGVSKIGFQRDTVDPWTLNTRLALWKLALSEVIEHPVLGMGYGNHTLAMRFRGNPEMGDIQLPHNVFVMVAAGSGIPGLVFLVWVLVGATRSLVCIAQEISDRQGYALMMGIAVMIVGFSVRNLFDDLFGGSIASLFWILVATGLAQAGMSHRTPRAK